MILVVNMFPKRYLGEGIIEEIAAFSDLIDHIGHDVADIGRGRGPGQVHGGW